MSKAHLKLPYNALKINNKPFCSIVSEKNPKLQMSDQNEAFSTVGLLPPFLKIYIYKNQEKTNIHPRHNFFFKKQVVIAI